MKYEYLARTQNGHKVYVDLERSHAATHIMDNPELLALVKGLLEVSAINGERAAFEKDMGRVIGLMDLVETDETDDIIYAKRLNRDIYTRFVKGREQAPTQYLTVILKQLENGYELWSAWVGRLVPSFPGDENEKLESREFWATHALVWGKQPVQEGTETSVRPW